jgi:MFS family permease
VTAAFWIAVIPAALAVLAIAVFVREPEFVATPVRRVPLSRTELARLPAAFWRVVLFAGVLTLARFSDAFLVLRAQSVGTPVAWIPVVMIVMNVVYAGAAYPAGVAADRMSRRALLGWGVALLIAADVVLAFADALPVVMAGVVLWGFHMAITNGLLSALVADHAPPDLRGTAFGVFHLASGVFLLLASGLAGMLWSTFGPGATFAAGAVFTAIAGAGLIVGARRNRA